jgi:F-type H+-transporting ATPase subunit b
MSPVLDHIEVIRAADNPLLKASPGLMIWTFVLFFITLYILKRYVFGPVSAMIERRRADIQASLEEAERSRADAERLLEDYRRRLDEARREADELRERGRRDGDRERASIVEAAHGQRERILTETERDVQLAQDRALTAVRSEVGELALAAAEKVTRRSLSDAEHRRLIEEAIQEIDLDAVAAPSPDGGGA